MKELTAALVKLQANLPEINKNKTANTGTFSYSYADLSSIAAQIMPLLSEHDLAWVTLPTTVDGQFVLAYKLLHVSGQNLEGFYPLLAANNAQAQGSAISYARRYALCAVTGIVPDEDDDGQAAGKPQRSAGKPKGGKPQPTRAAQANPETGEIPPPLSEVINKLDEEARKELDKRMKAANFPPLNALPTGAQKQVRKWIDEISAGPS